MHRLHGPQTALKPTVCGHTHIPAERCFLVTEGDIIPIVVGIASHYLTMFHRRVV